VDRVIAGEKSDSWKGTQLMASTKNQSHISRDDIESKLRALQGDVQGKVDDRRSTLLAIAGGVGVVLVVAFYLMGRRSGKRRSTVVEIRRV
jgi:hypothetical protein